MTHSIDAPLPPPTTTGPGATRTVVDGHHVDQGRRHRRGQERRPTAAQAGSQVASTAADQAKEVAAETQRQAKDLLDQGRAQLKDQAITQQQKAAQGLTSPGPGAARPRRRHQLRRPRPGPRPAPAGVGHGRELRRPAAEP